MTMESKDWRCGSWLTSCQHLTLIQIGLTVGQVIVTDHEDLAGKAGVADGLGCALGSATGDVDDVEVLVRGDQVGRLLVGGVGVVLVLDRLDDVDARRIGLEIVDHAVHAVVELRRTEPAGDDRHLALAAELVGDEFAGRLARIDGHLAERGGALGALG